jgi:hypothetical protein
MTVDILTGFIPLLIVGAFLLLALRLLRHAREGDPTDTATLVQQVALYGLLYLTMVFTAAGAGWASDELSSSSRSSDNSALAMALSLVALGLPIFAVLLSLADRRLRHDQIERQGVVWSLYLNAALLTSLIGTMVGGFLMVRDVLDDRVGQQLDASDVMMTIVWAAFWALHWFILLRRHGVHGDTHLAFGSILGIAVLGAGNIGLFYLGFDRLYTELTNDLQLNRAGPTGPEWAALFAVGVTTWLWYWLSHFEDAPRTDAWYTTVVPVGALSGFTSAIVAAMATIHLALVWWIGDPADLTALRHFDRLPFLLAVFATGAASLVYHRWLLCSEEERNDPIRVYDYLVMAMSLVASVIGAVLFVSALFHVSAVDSNELLAGLTIIVSGGMVWLQQWRRTTQLAKTSVNESKSQVRRTYIYVTLGAAGATLLIAGLVSLQGLLEALLDGELGLNTFREERIGLATVAVVLVAVVPHLRLLQDQRRSDEIIDLSQTEDRSNNAQLSSR